MIRKPRHSDPPLEAAITRSILRVLRSLPGLLVRKRHGSALGYAGEADLYGCYRGRHFEIEIKRPGRKATPLQEHRLKQWARAGALTGVVHSAQEALQLLDLDGNSQHGLPVQDRA